MAATDLMAPFKRGEKVRATTDLPRIPEGTVGKVAVVDGFSWIRYWVQFENGEALGSIDQSQLVRAKHWDDYLRERAAAAERAEAADGDDEAADEGAAAATAGGGDGVTVNGVLVPQLLLDRSAAARTRLGA